MSEMDIKQFVFRKGARNRIPVSGTFELTSRCNLDCKMCYVHMSKNEQEKIGRELTTEQWIRLGREAVDAGMIYLLLTGGEPLLRPDFTEIYTSLIQMGLVININTNAVPMTPEVVECFRKYRPERVNVTLYGSSPCTYGDLCGSTGGFQRAVRGIRMLKEAGIRVVLNTTFTKLNLGDMEDIVAFAKSEKIPVRMAAYVFPPVRNQHEPAEDIYLSAAEMGYYSARFDEMTMTPEQLQQRIALLRQVDAGTVVQEERRKSTISTCMAGRGAFWICWDGQMYPCGMLPNCAANVTEKSFTEAWKDICSQMSEVRLPSECVDCKYQTLCPTCAAVSLSATGRTDGVPDYFCTRTRAYMDYFLKK
ncbi:MAG: radical SAM protein [Clostridia bacterium]|nr:radical SAM protein [Clostridia bacterium]